MKLAALVREIEAAGGPITGVELAQRLDTNPAEIGAMLVALRASGWLVPKAPRHHQRATVARREAARCRARGPTNAGS